MKGAQNTIFCFVANNVTLAQQYCEQNPHPSTQFLKKVGDAFFTASTWRRGGSLTWCRDGETKANNLSGSSQTASGMAGNFKQISRLLVLPLHHDNTPLVEAQSYVAPYYWKV